MDALRGVAFALASAALFGASTPLAKALVGAIDPLWLAGLLYAGSGLGLSLVLLIRVSRDGLATFVLRRADLGWLAAGIACGGIVAPVLFTFGLRQTSGAAASLLGNLENVMTFALAWFVFPGDGSDRGDSDRCRVRRPDLDECRRQCRRRAFDRACLPRLGARQQSDAQGR